MKLGALAVLCSLAAGRPAMAEPCAVLVFQPKPLKAEVAASVEGGIVVGEIPTAQNGPADDRSGWKLRVKGKKLPKPSVAIAPGLFVYRPPGAASWELVDGKNKRLAKATFLAKSKEPELLDAPAATRVTSGTSQSRHPNSFVNVELSTPAPKSAVALVLSKSKGPALSWGVAFAGASSLSVFSTGSGCFSTQSEGTVQAQPGDTVTLFWVDQHGRRSRVTPPIVVEKP